MRITCFRPIVPGDDSAAFSRSRCFSVVPVLTPNTAGCVPAELTCLDRWRFVPTASNSEGTQETVGNDEDSTQDPLLDTRLTWWNYRSFWWSLLSFSDALWEIVIFENLNGRSHLQLIGSQKRITLVIVAWDYCPKPLGDLLAANICWGLGGWISLSGQFVGNLWIPWGGHSCMSVITLSYNLPLPTDLWLRKPLNRV